MVTATLKILLVYEYPKRLRTAEFSNWTGKAADQSSGVAEPTFRTVLSVV